MNAFLTGFRDGLEQTIELTQGMTYNNHIKQLAWDTGANLGQFIGKLKSKFLKGQDGKL